MQIKAEVTSPNLLAKEELTREMWRRVIEAAWLDVRSKNVTNAAVDLQFSASDGEPFSEISGMGSEADMDSGDEAETEWSRNSSAADRRPM